MLILRLLSRIPDEVVDSIFQYLSPVDLFNLSQTCYKLNYLIRDNYICQKCLERTARYSAEAILAAKTHDYARSLRIYVKRRAAVTSAQPFVAAVVARASSFIVNDNVLCYAPDQRSLRILDLSRSDGFETELDVRALIRDALPADQPAASCNHFRLLPLHYADGILSCIFRPCRSRARNGRASTRGMKRLVIIDAQRWRILLVTESLPAYMKDCIFVRNTDRHLVLGTRTKDPELGGFPPWTLSFLDLATREWQGSLTLQCCITGRVNIDTCFEIFDNHFYVLSSNVMDEWSDQWRMRGMDDDNMDDDGTDDDYLQQNLLALPSRYYVVRIPLAKPVQQNVEHTSNILLRRELSSTSTSHVDSRWYMLRLERDERTGWPVVVEVRREWSEELAGMQRTCYRKALVFPGDTNFTYAATTRLSRRHIGDGPLTVPQYTYGQCFLRSYFLHCDAYVDLINDPENGFMPSRLRYWVMSTTQTDRKKEEMDRNVVKTWPATDSKSSLAVLNPYSSVSPVVRSVVDGNTLVYAVGDKAISPGRYCAPLVLLSFDPVVHLPGMPQWSTKEKKARDAVSTSAAVADGKDDRDPNVRPKSDDGEESVSSTRPTSPVMQSSHVWTLDNMMFDPRYAPPWLPHAPAEESLLVNPSCLEAGKSQPSQDDFEPEGEGGSCSSTANGWATRVPATYLSASKISGAPHGYDYSL